MKDMGRLMGEWLETYNFNQVATIRPHYKMKEHQASTIAKRLTKHKSVDLVFIALEPDRSDSMKHAHVLFKATGEWNRRRLASEIGLNPKAIPFCQEIVNRGEIEVYCSKYAYRSWSFHDIYY